MADEVKEALKHKGLVMGANEVLRKLKNSKLKKVIVSKNCNSQVLDSIDHYAKLGNVEVVKTSMDNEQLAVACKKPFNISVIGY